MNARIEKKLSKKIVGLLPHYYKDVVHNTWWKSDKAFDEGNNVKNTLVVDIEYEYEAVWQDFRRNYMWICNFPIYPDGHFLEGYPNTESFDPTTQNLLNLARITIEG